MQTSSDDSVKLHRFCGNSCHSSSTFYKNDIIRRRLHVIIFGSIIRRFGTAVRHHPRLTLPRRTRPRAATRARHCPAGQGCVPPPAFGIVPPDGPHLASRLPAVIKPKICSGYLYPGIIPQGRLPSGSHCPRSCPRINHSSHPFKAVT